MCAPRRAWHEFGPSILLLSQQSLSFAVLTFVRCLTNKDNVLIYLLMQKTPCYAYTRSLLHPCFSSAIQILVGRVQTPNAHDCIRLHYPTPSFNFHFIPLRFMSYVLFICGPALLSGPLSPLRATGYKGNAPVRTVIRGSMFC